MPNGILVPICENREPRFSGTWKINKGILELSVIQRDVIEGGKIVDSVGSCDTMIEGGKVIYVRINPPRQVRYALSDLRLDKGINLVREPYQLMTIHIDGTPYWKFRDNPNEYE